MAGHFTKKCFYFMIFDCYKLKLNVSKYWQLFSNFNTHQFWSQKQLKTNWAHFFEHKERPQCANIWQSLVLANSANGHCTARILSTVPPQRQQSIGRSYYKPAKNFIINFLFLKLNAGKLLKIMLKYPYLCLTLSSTPKCYLIFFFFCCWKALLSLEK